jgi:hypothetical protein
LLVVVVKAMIPNLQRQEQDNHQDENHNGTASTKKKISRIRLVSKQKTSSRANGDSRLVVVARRHDPRRQVVVVIVVVVAPVACHSRLLA